MKSLLSKIGFFILVSLAETNPLYSIDEQEILNECKCLRLKVNIEMAVIDFNSNIKNRYY